MNASHGRQSAELESLVRRLVVEALGKASGVAPSRAVAAPPPRPATHFLGDAVISLGVLESLPEGVGEVEIASRAVLTPAAADRLREQQIRVVRGGSAQSARAASPPSHAASPDFDRGAWIADADHPERAAAYVRQLAHRGTSAAAAQLPLNPQRGRGDQPAASVGVVMAEVPAVHVDHFARVEGRSAVAVAALSDVAKIAALMSPAVWVLDSDRLSFSGRIAVAAECFRVSPTATTHSGGGVANSAGGTGGRSR